MINTPEQYQSASKQSVRWVKTTNRTTIATGWFTLYDVAGSPSGGTLNVGNTANGLVPTSATAGAPALNTFGVGNTGQIGTIAYGSSVACRMILYDRLFHAGAYSFNSNVTLSSQPSIASRIDGGDYKETEIWFEAVTAFTGSLTLTVTYTNQDGTPGRTTGAVAFGFAPTLGRMVQLPFQSGDTGVQKIESVVASVSTVGTFNILITRPLWTNKVKFAGDGGLDGILRTGMPVVFQDSCLHTMIAPDSTASGIPELMFIVANAAP